MKLIFCRSCNDVRRLFVGRTTVCWCGKSWGRYIDDTNAEMGGQVTPLGFANKSFAKALCAQPGRGDGKTFEAFVIPRICDSIEYPDEPFA